jgi:hypothetical protein
MANTLKRLNEISEEGEKAAENLAGYRAAKENIRAWKPVSFDDYRDGKLVDRDQPRRESRAKNSNHCWRRGVRQQISEGTSRLPRIRLGRTRDVNLTH